MCLQMFDKEKSVASAARAGDAVPNVTLQWPGAKQPRQTCCFEAEEC